MGLMVVRFIFGVLFIFSGCTESRFRHPVWSNEEKIAFQKYYLDHPFKYKVGDVIGCTYGRCKILKLEKVVGSNMVPYKLYLAEENGKSRRLITIHEENIQMVIQ